MKFIKVFFLFIFVLTSNSAFSQEKELVYKPDADANKDIENAVLEATKDNKHIFVQIGGNWCPWCIKMHEFYNNNVKVDSIMKADFVTILVNYSRDNRNKDIMTKYHYPQRFGFPVILILDEKGNLLHTQNSLYLEKGEGYNEKLFIDFLKNWNKNALNPENYK